MAASSLSSERARAVPPEALAELAESSTHPALTDPQLLLRRANAELELLYAVEQHIASIHVLPDLIAAVLLRVCASMGCELAALLVVDGGGADVISVRRGQTPQLRGVPLKDARRLIAELRTPQRRLVDAAASGGDMLSTVPGVSILESYNAPLSDGSVQCGVLQVLNPGDLLENEHTVLRRLGLVAAQLGRAIVLRREREAMLRAERMALLGQSVGAILHDMRTPLMAVAGYVEVMAGAESQELRREYAERAGRGLDHMERMVHEVLAFVRGQREVLTGKVTLTRFVEEVREMLLPELDRFGVRLEVQSEYTGLSRFDETKIKRVLWNLARNASQAGAKKFVWKIARAGEYLVFECEDDGPGIPKALDGKLFDSFATHGKAEGTGLGLSMAKKIIDAHCGRIHVRSEPGHGTVFRIELPI